MWLNDQIINFQMNLLIKRGTLPQFPSVYAMNTFFYGKIDSESINRWTSKIDLFFYDLLVIPIHLEIHWTLIVVDFRKKTIEYFDSFNSSDDHTKESEKIFKSIRKYLNQEYLLRKGLTFNFTDWNDTIVKNIPQQTNGNDCGVFLCTFANYRCADKKFNFTQENIPFFRKKMTYEVLTNQLMDLES